MQLKYRTPLNKLFSHFFFH